MKKITSLIILAFVSAMVLLWVIKVPEINMVYALEDNLSGRVNVQQQQTQGNNNNAIGNLIDEIKNADLDQNTKEVSDWFKNQSGVSGEQLETASNLVSPITNVIGYAIGIIICLTIVGVGLITALDLLYIAVPPIRNVLYKAGTDGTSAYTMRGGAMGMGMSMGGMGAGGAAGGTKKPTQWVSDEAVSCAALLGGSAQTGNMMAGSMMRGGPMGMGMGMGMPMGAPMTDQAASGNMTTKTVIWLYLKKRLFFLILLGVCVIVLTSSLIMNCGVNLANWFLKILSVINGRIS